VSDQKFVSKLHFVLNQSKVQFCPKVPYFAHKISKNFRGDTPGLPLREGTSPYRTHPQHGVRLCAGPRSSSPNLTPHFQIPSAVYGCAAIGWPLAANTAASQPMPGPADGVQCGARYGEFCRNSLFRRFPLRKGTLVGAQVDNV